MNQNGYMYFVDHIAIFDHMYCTEPGPEAIKLCSCSTQPSTKFQLLIKPKIPTNEEVSCFKSLRGCIYHDNKY